MFMEQPCKRADETVFDDVDAFLALARSLPADRPATARGVFLVAPDGMHLAAQSAEDNAYMDVGRAFDLDRALAEHRALQRALGDRLPVVCFAGDPVTPDAVFPNNVFATARVPGEAAGRFLIGRMRHPVRQREADRRDIHRFFEDLLGYRRFDLRSEAGLSELTGTLVIDRARAIGFAGLSPRCDRAGVEAMHRAFGLRATLCFPLRPGEYHTNVVMSVLAGRLPVLCAEAVESTTLVDALATLYGRPPLLLTTAEKQQFAGNCIALDATQAWMSQAAIDGLSLQSRERLQAAGFAVSAVDLAQIEKAGGSLRCCVGEIF